MHIQTTQTSLFKYFEVALRVSKCNVPKATCQQMELCRIPKIEKYSFAIMMQTIKSRVHGPQCQLHSQNTKWNIGLAIYHQLRVNDKMGEERIT